MTAPPGPSSFEPTARRARTLARLAAYSLGLTFAITVLAALLPLPLRDPQRALALAAEVLDRSPQLVLALVLLYHGLAEEGLPALWECRLALLLRPPLRLLPLLYLLLILVVGVAGHRVEARTVNGIRHQLDRRLGEVALLRKAVDDQPDATGLARLVEQQPVLQPAAGTPTAPDSQGLPLEEQRRRVLVHLDGVAGSVRTAALRSIADAGGGILRQQIRLTAAALAYGLFFLLAALIWPRSMAGPIARARERIASQPPP